MILLAFSKRGYACTYYNKKGIADFEKITKTMSSFSNWANSLGQGLLSAGTNALTGGLGGLISSGLGALGSLFGPSIKKQINMQKQAQMELNQQAAELNYQYGEQAAENAYNRQMAMYERSYQDQSYSAMRQQMQDAGLSVGLMYGQGGAGGGAGSMSGAPQGATGGAQAGNAAEMIGLALQYKVAQSEIAKNTAEANKINAEAQNVKADTEGKQLHNTQFENLMPIVQEDAKQTTWGKWLDNIVKHWEATTNPNEEAVVTKYINEAIGKEAVIHNDTAKGKSIRQTLAKLAAETEESTQRKQLLEAEEALRNKDVEYYFQKLLIETTIANAASGNAAAAKMQAETARKLEEFNTGKKFTADIWLGIAGLLAKAATIALIAM